MSQPIPDSTTRLHCKLNPPIPIIARRSNRDNDSYYIYRWAIPETEPNSFCAMHPDFLKN